MVTRRLMVQSLGIGLATSSSLRWAVAAELPLSPWRSPIKLQEAKQWSDIPDLRVIFGNCERINAKRNEFARLMELSRKGSNEESEKLRLVVRQQVDDILKTKLPEARKELKAQHWEVGYEIIGWIVGALCLVLVATGTATLVALGVGISILSIPVITLTKIIHERVANDAEPEADELVLVTVDTTADRWHLIVDAAEKTWPEFLKKTVAKLIGLVVWLWDTWRLAKTANDWTAAATKVTELEQEVTQLLANLEAARNDQAWWAKAHVELMADGVKQMNALHDIFNCEPGPTPNPPTGVKVQ